MVGSSAGKAAAFNCSLLWRVGGEGGPVVAAAQWRFGLPTHTHTLGHARMLAHPHAPTLNTHIDQHARPDARTQTQVYFS